MIKVAINGFGRIGSLAFRSAILADDIEVVAISAPNHPASHVAYCVKYDTVHGRFPGEVTANDEDSTIENITIGNNKAAHKEKVRKSIQESKKKSKKSSRKK